MPRTLTATSVAALPAAKACVITREGMPVKSFSQLAEEFGLSFDSLARKVGVSPRTLRNFATNQKPLSPVISEKIIRLGRLKLLARNLFTSDKAIADWFKTPEPALGGLLPIELVDNDSGVREVEGVLMGMIHGHVM